MGNPDLNNKMLITKEQQEAWVAEFEAQDNGYDYLYGFVLGIRKAIDEISKGCIDKQVAINFCQHLLKDYITKEVTIEDLNKFLKNY
jgi:hypothetical protein